MFGTEAAIIFSSSNPDEITVDWTLLTSAPSAALLNRRSQEPDAFLGLASRNQAMRLAV